MLILKLGISIILYNTLEKIFWSRYRKKAQHLKRAGLKSSNGCELENCECPDGNCDTPPGDDTGGETGQVPPKK